MTTVDGTGGASLESTLSRIADALDRLAPPPAPRADFAAADAFVWVSQGEASASGTAVGAPSAGGHYRPVPHVNRQPLALLCAVDRQAEQLLENTRRFAAGLPANNALLWGARGMGKSSLVKAVHACVNAEHEGSGLLKLIEIHREDIASLPACLGALRASSLRFIVFCDDLSFEAEDTDYKSLKAVLDGGIEGRPDNVVFYATSNRRHLISRDMAENERASALNPGDVVQEKVSLSDRFGLWLGFHNCSQDDYIAMIEGYAAHHGIPENAESLRAEAIKWAASRGSRSGRVAWQFIQDLAGRHGVALSDS